MSRAALGAGALVLATLAALAAPVGAVTPSEATATPAAAASAASAPRATHRRATVRAITPARAPRVGTRFFGMHAPHLGERFPDAPVGAVDLTTNGVYWPALEPSPGVWAFDRLDGILAQARAHGATPLLVLGGSPAFHSASLATPAWPSVPRMRAWKAYVTDVVTHVAETHPGPIDYQIWPEPNVPNNFTGTPQQLADLVAAASAIIRRVDPDATVVAPAMVLRFRGERRFMYQFFDTEVRGTPVGDLVDAVGVDPYPLQDGTPEDALLLVRAAQRRLARAGVTAPMWTLEVNYGVPSGGITPAGPMPARTQAAYVVRTYVTSAAAGVRRVYWLGWLRYFSLGVQMVEEDGETPTAAGRAFARAHDWLLGQRPRGCVRDRGTGVYACTFVKDGRTSRIYWTRAGATRLRLPEGFRRVERMDGARFRVPSGARVRVTTAPVRVVGN